MICPRCHAEYRPGFTTCSDCGVALVDEIDAATDGGVEVEETSTGLVPFHETWSSDELAAILEAFEEHAVAYVVQAGTALSLLQRDVDSGDLPEEWHARLLVPGAHRGRAKEILRELKEQALVAATRAGGERAPI